MFSWHIWKHLQLLLLVINVYQSGLHYPLINHQKVQNYQTRLGEELGLWLCSYLEISQ